MDCTSVLVSQKKLIISAVSNSRSLNTKEDLRITSVLLGLYSHISFEKSNQARKLRNQAAVWMHASQ